MPENLAIKLNLKEELNIKILSKLLLFKYLINFNAPNNPSCFPLDRSFLAKICILLIYLVSVKNCSALEFSRTNISIGVEYFSLIAFIKGKKITVSPIPFLFWTANIFIITYKLY